MVNHSNKENKNKNEQKQNTVKHKQWRRIKQLKYLLGWVGEAETFISSIQKNCGLSKTANIKDPTPSNLAFKSI